MYSDAQHKCFHYLSVFWFQISDFDWLWCWLVKPRVDWFWALTQTIHIEMINPYQEKLRLSNSLKEDKSCNQLTYNCLVTYPYGHFFYRGQKKLILKISILTPEIGVWKHYLPPLHPPLSTPKIGIWWTMGARELNFYLSFCFLILPFTIKVNIL